jgi:hypothetical protein
VWWMHYWIVHRGYDSSGVLGGIRTHTVWCLRPLSLPLEYEDRKITLVTPG